MLALVGMLGQILHAIMNIGQIPPSSGPISATRPPRRETCHHLALAHPDAVLADRPPGARAVQADLVAPGRQSGLRRGVALAILGVL